jgi:protein SCO1/2
MPGIGVCLLITVLVFSSCRRETSPVAASAGSDVRHFDVTGTVQSIDRSNRTAVISHAAIPTYMDAMTMPFQFADDLDLSALKRGDQLRFRLAVAEARAWVDQFETLGHINLPPSAHAPQVSARIGARPPATELQDQDGTPFRLSELRDRTVALTFLFTRCPYPEMCPRLSRQFAEAQRALLATHPDAGWLLLSITIDPDYDTPERLAAYAKAFAPDPKHWRFATGSPEAIKELAAWFGLEMIPSAGPTLEHTLRTAVIAPSGKVTRVFDGNNWSTDDLIEEMQQALDDHPERSAAE